MDYETTLPLTTDADETLTVHITVELRLVHPGHAGIPASLNDPGEPAEAPEFEVTRVSITTPTIDHIYHLPESLFCRIFPGAERIIAEAYEYADANSLDAGANI